MVTSTGQMLELSFKRLKTLWNISLTTSGAIYGQQLQMETLKQAAEGFFFNVKKVFSLVH